MRLAFIGLAVTLSALPLSAQEVERLSLSSVTLATTYSRTAEANDPVTRNGNTVISTPRLDTVRFGNAELLEVMRQQGRLNDTSGTTPVLEPSIKGWVLSAVWADWPGTGNSYRFFARKRVSGQIRVIAVPEELLRLDLNAFYVSKNVRLNEGAPVSGTFLYKASADLNLGADTRSVSDDEAEDGVRRGTASVTDGVFVSSGRYVRPKKTQSVIFVPGRATFTGYGQSEPEGESTTRDIVIANLRLGAASAVDAGSFPATSGNNSRGPETVGSVDTSGVLVIGASGTGDGSETITDGTITSSGFSGGTTFLVP